ncbi:MAG: hypothetical protein SFV55_17150 [Haliscomenobacter sp.]|uniref:hypothetical protein n=1 Tax=Haliscomenobacter sp. TaxID=2717303 RepID=UPI0029AC448F|nr:hypothetical protein [Haliscomenobacter sp.]MDX2070159.1 hypothetical protein [Haliscomenobacter sp.]
MNKRLKHVEELIGKDEILGAIKYLEDIIAHNSGLTKYRNEIILLNARFHEIQKMDIMGLSSREDHQLSINNLRSNILKLTVNISITLEEKAPKPTAAPTSTLGCGPIILPLIVVSLIIGIVGLSYNYFFHISNANKLSIFGKVYDADDNVPLKNARVEVIDLIGVFSNTDSNGAFEFEIEDIDEKYLEFQVIHANYETQSFKILIKPNKNNEQSLEKFLLKEIEKDEPNYFSKSYENSSTLDSENNDLNEIDNSRESLRNERMLQGTSKYMELTILVNSEYSNSEIFIDGTPANIIKNTWLSKRISLKVDNMIHELKLISKTDTCLMTFYSDRVKKEIIACPYN